ncbi:uncharacterized protein LOC116601533 isoform X2 [Nematostella vectensis]|uniref:uncharacterized protein LOC116601533 isoform X2 n=1 Tax=Nematostella vectensis TaxID=45351 RepID=UPI0013904394|nr:uncharacterized protein LOC116601533 isoform X2 [Nematostella vectensis]
MAPLDNLFLLLAVVCFTRGIASAITPPACNVVPAADKCAGGIFSQCARDNDCPAAKKCCWDGCYRRCTDVTKTSTHVQRTKHGTCPRVHMVFPCTAKADFCLDDSHCAGDEKCCIGQDCGKNCMLPQHLTKVKKEQNKKKDMCPFLLAPISCEKPVIECSSDIHCSIGMKCCSDTCNSKCVESQTLEGIGRKAQIVPITEPIILDKPGQCPILEMPEVCNPHAYECNYDVDCWDSDKKCCDNGCTSVCVPPVTQQTTALPTSKRTPTPATEPVFTTQRTPTAKQMPTTERIPTSEQKPTTKRVPTTGQIQATPEMPTTKQIPITERMRSTKQMPATYQFSTTNKMPMSEKKPTTKQLPITEKKPTTTKLPMTEQIPTTNKMPMTEKKPTTKQLPITEKKPTTTKLPMTEQIPTTKQTAMTEKKPTTERKHRTRSTPEILATSLESTTMPLRSTSAPTERSTSSQKPTSDINSATSRAPSIAIDVMTTEEPTYPSEGKEGIWIFPDRLMTEAGKTAGAACTVRGEPFEGWYSPKGIKITSTDTSDNVHVTKQGQDYFLVIKKTDVSHGGKYMCRGAFEKTAFDLKIKVAVEKKKSFQYLRPGEVGLIEVSIRGYPLPKSKWIKDNQPLNYRTGRYAVGKMGFLGIKNVQRSDKGMYSLVLDNALEADVEVQVVQESCPTPTYSAACLDSDAIDKCQTDRDCQDQFKCCFDGCRYNCILPKPDPAEHSTCPVMSRIPYMCNPTTHACDTDDDCIGGAKCCSDSCSRRCTAPDQTRTEPQVKAFSPGRDRLNTGEAVRRVCLVYRQPFVGWFASNGQKIMSSRDERMFVEDHGIYKVLVIRNVTVEDAGTYECQGALHNATTEIKVKMDIGEFRDAIMLKPGAIGLVPLAIRSYPLSKFVWYKRGRPLDMDSGRFSVSPSGSLGIRRVRSVDVGIYTLKAQGGDEGVVQDTGISVAVAVEGVDFTVWQESFAPGATVRCLKNEMYIELERKVLDGYSVKDLSLADPSCRAVSNGTHYSFKAPLVGCGTKSKFAKDAVVYSNVVKEFRGADNMITRVQDVNIPFSCFYTSEGVTSTFGLLPMKIRRVMDGGNATTNFVLSMELFREQSFTNAYATADFPLRVTVNNRLFVQVSIDSPDKRLNVRADRCYATPTQNPNHMIQYDIIREGCKVDPTVVDYPGPSDTQRFSFKAFKFISPGQQFVYLHCHLLVCNASDPNSRCAQSCSSFSRRYRRSAAEVELTQGPIMLVQTPPDTLTQKQEASSWTMYVWVVGGMAAFCFICLIAMAYMRKQISKQRSKADADPARETNV